jgi:hypothetical protein
MILLSFRTGWRHLPFVEEPLLINFKRCRVTQIDDGPVFFAIESRVTLDAIAAPGKWRVRSATMSPYGDSLLGLCINFVATNGKVSDSLCALNAPAAPKDRGHGLVGFVIACQRVHHEIDAAAQGKLMLPLAARL